jgi:hypothetical protein
MKEALLSESGVVRGCVHKRGYGHIAHQRLQIEKLTRQLYGPRSERTVRVLDQMELAFEELESSASEDEIAAERAVAKTKNVVAFTRKCPARQPFPDHLPRERVVEPGPVACLCCGSPRLRKPGRGRHRDAGGDPAAMEEKLWGER